MFRNRRDDAMEKCAVGDVAGQALGPMRGYHCRLDPGEAQANLARAAGAR